MLTCDEHIHDQPLGYLTWHERAEESERRGETQTQCSGCGRYYFPWERTGHQVSPVQEKP